MKKFLFFIGALVLIVSIAWMGYWLSQKNQGGAQIEGGGGLVLPEDIVGNGGLPGTQNSSGGLSEVKTSKTRVDVFDFLPVSEEEVVYVKTDGKIIRERGGVLESLSEAEVGDLQGSSISRGGLFVFIGFGDRNAPQSSVFNTTNKTWQPLAESISAHSWSLTGTSLAYLARGQSGNDLIVRDFADPKSKPKKIISLHAKDLQLDWVAKDRILLAERTSAYTTGSAWIINLSSTILEKAFPDQLGLRVKWNDLMDGGLAWTGNRAQRGGELLLIGPKQNIVQKFEFMTLPDKCTFNTEVIEVATTTKIAGSRKTATTTVEVVGKTNLFCGVPQDQRSFQINPIPDAYDQRLIYTEDNIYKIDVANGNIQLLPQSSLGSIDVNNIKISGKKIFILNRFNNNLIELPIF